MNRLKEAAAKRVELLRRLRLSPARIEGGMWSEAWRELIESGASEVEADCFFAEIANTAHPSGAYSYKARASEGRRVFAYALEARERALELLDLRPYNKAIDMFPKRAANGAPRSGLKAIRRRIDGLLDEMNLAQLRRLHQELMQKTRAPQATPARPTR